MGESVLSVLYGADNTFYGPRSPPLTVGDRIYLTVAQPDGGDLIELRQASQGGAWVKRRVYEFTEGNIPSGPLLTDGDGAIYGVTNTYPPAAAVSTIYRVKP